MYRSVSPLVGFMSRGRRAVIGAALVCLGLLTLTLFIGTDLIHRQFERPQASEAGLALPTGGSKVTSIRATGMLLVTLDSQYGWCYHVLCPDESFITLGVLMNPKSATITSEIEADYFGDPLNCHRQKVTARAEYIDAPNKNGETVRFCESLRLDVWDGSHRNISPMP